MRSSLFHAPQAVQNGKVVSADARAGVVEGREGRVHGRKWLVGGVGRPVQEEHAPSGDKEDGVRPAVGVRGRVKIDYLRLRRVATRSDDHVWWC